MNSAFLYSGRNSTRLARSAGWASFHSLGGMGTSIQRRRMPVQAAFETADHQMIGAVEIERGDGRPAGGSAADGPAGTFAQRAMDAGERQVFRNRRPTRHLWHDVVHMEGGGLSLGRQPTVFAAIARTLGDEAPQFR